MEKNRVLARIELLAQKIDDCTNAIRILTDWKESAKIPKFELILRNQDQEINLLWFISKHECNDLIDSIAVRMNGFEKQLMMLNKNLLKDGS